METENNRFQSGEEEEQVMRRSDWQRTKIGGKIVVSAKGGDRRKRKPVLWGTGMKNLSSCHLPVSALIQEQGE